jgi:hypothetical protein
VAEGVFRKQAGGRDRALVVAMRDLEIFLRAGVYTAHDFREDEPTVLLALSSSYELGGL